MACTERVADRVCQQILRLALRGAAGYAVEEGAEAVRGWLVSTFIESSRPSEAVLVGVTQEVVLRGVSNQA